MSDLYWITRLDAVCVMLIVVMFVAFIAMLLGFMEWNIDNDIKRQERGRKILRLSLITFLFSVFMYVFIPDTKQALIIYGVGGTIDYVKSNDKAKQLPDKVIDVLDKYLDSIDKGGEE
jgi:hypothetical protein